MKTSVDDTRENGLPDTGQAGPGPGNNDKVWGFKHLGNLRDPRYSHRLPEGKCMYIQSGDPSDFDGETKVYLAVSVCAQVP
eukprot:scaffold150254_cov41-Prasinocladus_malaysianus.AAC.1